MDKKEIGFHLRMLDYKLPDNPKELKHKKMSLIEWLAGLIVCSHVCVVCGRKEIWSVNMWYFVNKEEVVCDSCYDLNPEIFN